jgi:hypothetical protein
MPDWPISLDGIRVGADRRRMPVAANTLTSTSSVCHGFRVWTLNAANRAPIAIHDIVTDR